MFRLTSFGGLSLAGDGQVLTGAAARRRPLALLAVLASAGERGLSRDKAVAYFWPEGDTERSRHALAQTLYSIRHDLGADVVLTGANDLRLNPACIATDLWEFERAVAAGERETAVALYGGPFLDGFYISDAAAFERWAEEERARYAYRHRQLLEELAKQAAAAGDARRAIEWWRRVVTADPMDARATLAYMTALAEAGDAAAALRHARVYEAIVRQELKLPPDDAVRRYARELREKVERPGPAMAAHVEVGRAANPAPSALAAREVLVEAVAPRSTPWRMLAPSTTELVPEPVPALAAAPPHPIARRRRRRVILSAIVGAAALVAVSFAARQRGSEARGPVVLAVGSIREFGGSDSLGIARALAEMLSTNVARIQTLRVISNARIYELLSHTSGQSVEERVESAALRAGASQLVEGSLYLQPSKPMRLDVRLVDIASGAVRGAYSVSGKDLFALVDSATAQLAHDFDPHGTVLRVADVTTTSLIAHRFYDEGLRALYQRGDHVAALRLFQLALREDSSFAMAAYYTFLVATGLGDSSSVPAELLSLQNAAHASDHERLLINAAVRVSLNDPAGAIYAESLAARYPTEPDGIINLAGAKIEGGDFLGALPLLRRVIDMDSVSLRRETIVKGLPCGACAAYGGLFEAYWRADSLDAVLRIAREYLGRQPWSPLAIESLGTALEYNGRYDEGERELARASDLTGGAVFGPLRRAELLMRAGRLTEADQLLEALVAGHDDPAPERSNALWWLTIERRNEGRLREADRTTRRIIALWPTNFEAYEAYGQCLFEEGRYSEAAHIFDSLIVARPSFPHAFATRIARQQAWYLAHLTTAVAAMGDTMRLRRLADSLQAIGSQSAYGRDRLLHHYARGLLYKLVHNDERAIGELRGAIYSANLGYTRINYELGKLLLARGRANDAVAVVRPALFGSLEASNAYVTRTELHELLAQAFDALHQGDSAAAHYRSVIDAWHGADPQFRQRYEAARARLPVLSPDRRAQSR